MRHAAPRAARGAHACAALAILLGSAAACGSVSPPPPTTPSGPPSIAADPTQPPGLIRLIVLVGPADELILVRLANGTPTPLFIPHGRPAWISGDSRRGLVLTDRDGTLRTAGPFGRGGIVGAQPTWTVLKPILARGVSLRHPLSFATLSPDGSRIAAIAEEPAEGAGSGQLVVLDPRAGAAVAIDLDEVTDGRPAVWLGDDEILVPTRDSSDRTDVTVIHPATGGRSRWTIETSAIAAASDSRLLAVQAHDDRGVAVGPADEVANGGAALRLPGAEPGALAAQMVLDATGTRLAIAWLDDAGDTRVLAVYERRGDAWAIVRRDVLPPASNRAIIAAFDP